jgi:hypothetical protein
MYQNQPPLQNMANNMATYGRYGDSMLVHMNPAEVQGIAALSPTGSLTTNPVTGQPEAFLPFLAPLLGSMFGSTMLGALGGSSLLGGTALGSALTSAAGNAALSGAIGSGLATTAVTGDLKKGLLSGITGFGLGKALGAASDALNPQIGETAAALGDASTAASEAGKNLALTAAETADPIAKAIEMGAAPATNPLTGELVSQGFSPAAVTDPFTGAAMNPVLNQSQMALADPMQKLLGAEGVRNAANANVANLSEQLSSLRGAQTAGDKILAPFKQPGAFGKALMQPATLAAIGTGEGKIAEIDARELAERNNRRFEEEKQAEYDRAIGIMEGSYDQLESDYAHQNYKIPRMGAGGVTSINPQHYADNIRGLQELAGAPVQMFPGGEIPIGGQGGSGNYNFAPTGRAGSGARQSGIRGTQVISAEELQGTRPGFQPEITYFRAPRPAEGSGGNTGTQPVTGTEFPVYNVDLSGLDLSNLDLSGAAGIGGFNVQDYLSTPEGDATVGTINDVLNVPDEPRTGGGRGFTPRPDPSGPINSSPDVTYEDIVAQTTRSTGPIGGPGGNFEPEIGQMPPELQAPYVPMPSTPPAQTAPPPATTPPFASSPAVGAGGIMDVVKNFEPEMPVGMQLPPSLEVPQSIEPAPAPIMQAAPNRRISDPPMSAPAPAAEEVSPSMLVDLYNKSPAAQDFSTTATYDPETGLYTEDVSSFGFEGDAATKTYTQEEFMERIGYSNSAPEPSTPPPPKRGPVRTVGRKDLEDTSSEQAPKRKGPKGRGGRRRMNLGGETAMDETLESNGQLLIERAVQAISGQLDEEQASAIVASFIDEFGPEAFQMLREKVLEQIVPGSQKEGEIRGVGGGMDDMIPGMIGDSQPVAVSPGEYIVPADVVSGLGDGSTDAGVVELDQMLDRVRQERTGTLRQPAPMRVGGVLPA